MVQSDHRCLIASGYAENDQLTMLAAAGAVRGGLSVPLPTLAGMTN